MKKFIYLPLIMAFLAIILPANAGQYTFTFADPQFGFVGGENLTEMGTLPLNEDICLVFEGGNSNATFNKNGYIQSAINSSIYVKGTSENVSITGISFNITANSYRFYVDSTEREPEGEFTWDADTKTNTWTYPAGANVVKFNCGGTVRFTTIAVTYTDGSSEIETPTGPKEFTFTLNDDKYGLSGGENLVELSPLSLNEDINIIFEKGNSDATYNNSGYAQVPINSTIYIKGATEDVNISEISFKITANSYRFYVDNTVRDPEGEFTWDADTKTNTWTYPAGANVVKFICDGTVRFTELTVKYTGGTASGGSNTEPEEPEIPETPADSNLLSTGFDTTAEWNQFTIINVQEGSNTWKHSNANPYAKIENDLGNTIPKDDYLVSPALNMKSGNTYRLTFDTWCGAPDYPEIIAAYLLTSKENITDKREIIAPTEITNPTSRKRNLNGEFTIDSDGEYYVAIHAASAPGMHYLYADNIEVSRGVNSLSPGEVTDFKVTPSPIGEKEITVSLKAPTLCYDGTTPVTGLQKIIIMRDGTVIGEPTAQPGQQISIVDNVSADGWYTYSATAVTTSSKSLDAKATVYVGIARPETPASLTAVETEPGKVRLSWEPVTTNIYGMTIDPSIVEYNIYEDPYTGFMPGVKGDFIEFEYVQPDEGQKIATFTLRASIAGSESTGYASAPTMAVGTPYEMPFVESFSTGHVDYPSEIHEDTTRPSELWRCYESMSSPNFNPVTFDRGMLIFLSNYNNMSSVYTTAKININEDAEHPYLSFFNYVIPGADDILTVSINGNIVKEMNVDGETEGWMENLIALDDYKGETIRITFKGYIPNGGGLIAIDNLSVKDELLNDLAITRARIPYEMIIGNEHNCSVKIINNGVMTADIYTVNVFRGEEMIKTFEGTNLNRGEEATFNFTLSPEPIPADNLVYKVILNYETDENESDNTAEIPVAVLDHFMPVATGLRVQDNMLSWNPVSDSDFTNRNITESFEAYDEFEINNAGEWTFMDGDNYPTFGMEDGYHTYPNMYAPMAYMVFNNHDNYFTGMGTMTYDIYDGGQCLVSMAIDTRNMDPATNDDWLVSPRLSGNAQTISFYARSTSMVFRESFQILYSTSDDPSASYDFRVIEQYDEIDPVWTEFTAEIPAGSTYFAIRNISDNKYLFFVDNVSFEAAPIIADVVGYDVYKYDETSDSWVKLNSEILNEPTFNIEAETGDTIYRIHTHYDNGIETVSGSYLATGIDNILLEEETETEYFNLNGLRIKGQPSTPGIYIKRDALGTHKILIGK